MYMNIIYTYIQYKMREIPKSPALGHIFLVPDSSQMKKGWKLDDLPSFSLVRKKSTAAEKLENPWPQSVSIIRRSSAGVFDTKKRRSSSWKSPPDDVILRFFQQHVFNDQPWSACLNLGPRLAPSFQSLAMEKHHFGGDCQAWATQ